MENKIKTIIIADDDERIRRVLVKLLKRHLPDEVIIYDFSNGYELYTYVQKEKVDLSNILMILDIDMPKMSGEKVLKSLGEKYLKVIISSGSITDKNKEYFKKFFKTYPNLKYLAKPYMFEVLLETLKKDFHLQLT